VETIQKMQKALLKVEIFQILIHQSSLSIA